MSNMLKALEDLIFRGLELFLMGALHMFLIALLIAPIILTFFAKGQAQQVGLVLLIIEVLIGVGLLAEACN